MIRPTSPHLSSPSPEPEDAPAVGRPEFSRVIECYNTAMGNLRGQSRETCRVPEALKTQVYMDNGAIPTHSHAIEGSLARPQGKQVALRREMAALDQKIAPLLLARLHQKAIAAPRTRQSLPAMLPVRPPATRGRQPSTLGSLTPRLPRRLSSSLTRRKAPRRT